MGGNAPRQHPNAASKFLNPLAGASIQKVGRVCGVCVCMYVYMYITCIIYDVGCIAVRCILSASGLCDQICESFLRFGRVRTRYAICMCIYICIYIYICICVPYLTITIAPVHIHISCPHELDFS